MKHYHNIEPSKLRPDEYIGHATGAWRIKRSIGGWHVHHHSGLFPKGYTYFHRETLGEVSSTLEAINRHIAKGLRS